MRGTAEIPNAIENCNGDKHLEPVLVDFVTTGVSGGMYDRLYISPVFLTLFLQALVLPCAVAPLTRPSGRREITRVERICLECCRPKNTGGGNEENVLHTRQGNSNQELSARIRISPCVLPGVALESGRVALLPRGRRCCPTAVLEKKLQVIIEEFSGLLSGNLFLLHVVHENVECSRRGFVLISLGS